MPAPSCHASARRSTPPSAGRRRSPEPPRITRPKAFVSVSAHTAARVPVVLGAARHEAIYDFGNFDRRLNELRYDPPGDPALVGRLTGLLRAAGIAAQQVDEGGLDHGAWTALRYIYPDAAIPIVPLAFVPSAPPAKQFALGAAL